MRCAPSHHRESTHRLAPGHRLLGIFHGSLTYISGGSPFVRAVVVDNLSVMELLDASERRRKLAEDRAEEHDKRGGGRDSEEEGVTCDDSMPRINLPWDGDRQWRHYRLPPPKSSIDRACSCPRPCSTASRPAASFSLAVAENMA